MGRVKGVSECCKGPVEGCVTKTRSMLTSLYPWKDQPPPNKVLLYYLVPLKHDEANYNVVIKRYYHVVTLVDKNM